MPESSRYPDQIYRQAETQIQRQLQYRLETPRYRQNSFDILQYLHPFFRSEACDKAAMADFRQVVIDFSIDQGLAEERYFEGECAPAVYMQNRSAFVGHLLREFRRADQTIETPQILYAKILDIAKFRRADQAVDDDGNRGADFNINLIAATVNERVNAINNILKANEIEGYAMPCRYGGDELGFALIEIPDGPLQTTIYEAIVGENGFQDGITHIEGYVQLRNRNIKKPIKIKAESRFKKIEIPKDTLRQRVFWNQLDKGLLINDEEVEAILSEGEPIEEYRPQLGYPNPDDLEGFDNYINQLEYYHPELTAKFEIVRRAAHDDDPEAALFVRTEFPRIVRDVVFDRLLGDRVTPYGDFARHIDDFSDAFVFDMKGIKEFNDYQSVATGDRAIVALWKAIQEQIVTDMNQVMCFRRGSTFIVGVRPGTKTEEIKRRLETITSVMFQNNPHIIGLHHSSLSEDLPEEKRTKKEIKEYIAHIIEEADRDWNRKVIDGYLFVHPELIEDRQIREGTKYSFMEEIAVYFNGARSLDRFRKLIEELAAINETVGNTASFNSLRLAIAKQLVKAAHNEIQTNIMNDDPDELIDMVYRLGQIAEVSHALDIHDNEHTTDGIIKNLFEQYGLDQYTD